MSRIAVGKTQLFSCANTSTPSRDERSRSRKEIKLFQNKGGRRRRTIFKKADELRECGARVYLLVEMNNLHYTYNSELSSSWPPSPGKIVGAPFPTRFVYAYLTRIPGKVLPTACSVRPWHLSERYGKGKCDSPSPGRCDGLRMPGIWL
jgi:hypothetical protein